MKTSSNKTIVFEIVYIYNYTINESISAIEITILIYEDLRNNVFIWKKHLEKKVVKYIQDR
jgi:hypothetical protein